MVFVVEMVVVKVFMRVVVVVELMCRFLWLWWGLCRMC